MAQPPQNKKRQSQGGYVQNHIKSFNTGCKNWEMVGKGMFSRDV